MSGSSWIEQTPNKRLDADWLERCVCSLAIVRRRLQRRAVRAMTEGVMCLLLMVAMANHCLAEDESHHFLSWYNGYGRHTVWGLGDVLGPYASATAKCGSSVIKVLAIYDTHRAQAPPTEDQSADYARTRNLELIRVLEHQGIGCRFEPTVAVPNTAQQPTPAAEPNSQWQTPRSGRRG
jgi:hypothetical protein